MRQINEGTALPGIIGTVATPGTVTGAGLDFSPYYEPSFKAVAAVGAISAGTVVVHVQGGTASGDGSVSYGTIQAAGGAQGTTVYELNVPDVTTRYVRALTTVAGGTVTPVSVSFIAKAVTT
ncbi:hypothetical protein [Actinomarinicola tropica]|uniref:Uncharacterized protein n=1 Tax=Actinomarinicola tropica TaxID=2789776 RepID=A0A5Q2RIH9_9ACTN|nr:hypothetical protein [Actinomarinicola tropica]QGG95603.1 hypothetical protein GH723_11130 [Actinomarinicola tropica]